MASIINRIKGILAEFEKLVLKTKDDGCSVIKIEGAGYDTDFLYYREVFVNSENKIVMGISNSGAIYNLFFFQQLIDYLSEEVQKNVDYYGLQYFEQDKYVIDEKMSGKSAYEEAQELYRNVCQIISLFIRNAFSIDCDAIDMLSLENYEQEKCRGLLRFYPSGKSNTSCGWKVDEEILFDMREIRKIRKILAGAEGFSLCFECKKNAQPVLLGVESNSSDDKNVSISIKGPLSWELQFKKKEILIRTSNGFVPSKNKSEEQLIITALDEMWGKRTADMLVNIITAIKHQTHGASAVVAEWSGGAPEAAFKRLLDKNRLLLVRWSEYNKELITSAAKMDGTIFLDANSGEICAVAVIVDGVAVCAGDTSRGSRFNSIKNFTEIIGENDPVVSFVFSSDGGMDIFYGNRTSIEENRTRQDKYEVVKIG